MRIALIVSGCKGVDKRLSRLAAYRKGFRVMIYELKQFADPSELEPVVQYLESTYKEAPLYAIGLEYEANLPVRHSARAVTTKDLSLLETLSSWERLKWGLSGYGNTL
jgi:hypothetical protein